VTARGARKLAVASRGVVASTVAAFPGGGIDVVITTGCQRAQSAIALRGVRAARVAFFIGDQVGIPVAAPAGLAAGRSGHVGVTARRVHRARVALLAVVRIGRPVAAVPVYQPAIEITDPVGDAIQIAVVTSLTKIQDPVPALLGRRAVVAARIEDKYTSLVHLTIDEVAIVALLAWVKNTIATVGWEIETAGAPDEL
jgi:hypothetical protein